MKIQIIATGGTFDKEYDELSGKLYFKDTHVPEMLSLGRSRAQVEITTLMMIDSLDMKEADRKLILEKCQQSVFDRVVITHGTDTLEQTAQVLGRAGLPKTIVITGAMIPYKFGSSDGLFNLGSALAFVQALPVGVYVAMNGRYFDWKKVTKDREHGEFREK